MHPTLALLATCVLTSAIAVGTRYAWLAISGDASFPIPAAVGCLFVSVALVVAVEHSVLAVRRRRARTGPSRHRKAAR